MRNLTCLFLLGITVALFGCDRSPDGGSGDHAHGPDTHTHDDAPAPEVADTTGHGDPVTLDPVTSGVWTVGITHHGPIEAGGEGHIDIDVTGGTPAAVRVWVGLEDGLQSVKSKAHSKDEPGAYHAHVEIPAPIPAGSGLWVEVEDESGTRTRAMLVLK